MTIKINKTNIKKNLKVVIVVLLLFLFSAFIILLVNDDGSPKEEQGILGNEEQTNSTPAPNMFDEVLAEGAQRTGNFRVQGCSAISIFRMYGGEIKIVGVNEGKFDSLVCNIYLPEEKSVASITVTKEGTYLSDVIPVEDEFITALNSKPYYNDLLSVISTEEVYEIALENGLDTENCFYNMHIGEGSSSKYDDRYVWTVEALGKVFPEGSEIPTIKQRYYIDAMTGEVLDTDSLGSCAE